MTRAVALCLGFVLASRDLLGQCPDGSPPPCPRPAPSANSVAVLAFRNVTRDTAFDYLSEGLSAEITTSLAAVARLEVRSPGVVRSVQRSATADPRNLGRQLNVHYIVEGEYQRGGDRVRIAVRLVTVATGTQRWGNAWTQGTADLLTVQEQVAHEVATAIAGELLPGERAALASPTRNSAAWDHFLRGSDALRRRDLSAAREEYETAVALDSTFGRAWARLAYTYGLALDRRAVGGLASIPAETLLARGTRAADRALAWDAKVSDAWMARAMLAEVQDVMTFAGSREAFERAVTLDPRNEEAWHQYGSLLAYLGQDSAAFAAWRRVLELDPGRPQTKAEIARLDVYQRRYGDAVQLCRDSSVMVHDPRTCLEARFQTGDTTGALAAVEVMNRLFGSPDPELRAQVLGGGLTDRGDTLMVEALHRARSSCPELVSLGLRRLRVGPKDSVVVALETCTPRGPKLWFYLRSPAYDLARSDPRFQSLWNELRPTGASP